MIENHSNLTVTSWLAIELGERASEPATGAIKSDRQKEVGMVRQVDRFTEKNIIY